MLIEISRPLKFLASFPLESRAHNEHEKEAKGWRRKGKKKRDVEGRWKWGKRARLKWKRERVKEREKEPGSCCFNYPSPSEWQSLSH